MTETEQVEVVVYADDPEARTLRIAMKDDVEHLDPNFGQANLTNLVLKNTYMQSVQYLPGPSQGRLCLCRHHRLRGWLGRELGLQR